MTEDGLDIDKFNFAPFPWFGGKRNVCAEVWQRFGRVTHYIEPFCGSAAMLLAAPNPAGLEVICDQNYYIANFWRCIKYQPESTFEWQDYPVSHVDLDARHVWLTKPDRAMDLMSKLSDPEWIGDAQIAGWWVWGQCCWIGSGWCEKEKHIGDAGRGVQSKIPHISNAGRGVQSQIPHIGDAGRGVHQWFQRLSRRLERVRVLHGDWTRCLNTHYGADNTAVFLDPPYKGFEALYQKGSSESLIAAKVETWCKENENLKIALCGHIGDYDLPGWREMKWTRGKLTYGGKKTTDQECIWFSPTCNDPEEEIQGRLV